MPLGRMREIDAHQAVERLGGGEEARITDIADRMREHGRGIGTRLSPRSQVCTDGLDHDRSWRHNAMRWRTAIGDIGALAPACDVGKGIMPGVLDHRNNIPEGRGDGWRK